jgi:hypothetical protein
VTAPSAPCGPGARGATPSDNSSRRASLLGSNPHDRGPFGKASSATRTSRSSPTRTAAVDGTHDRPGNAPPEPTWSTRGSFSTDTRSNATASGGGWTGANRYSTSSVELRSTTKSKRASTASSESVANSVCVACRFGSNRFAMSWARRGWLGSSGLGNSTSAAIGISFSPVAPGARAVTLSRSASPEFTGSRVTTARASSVPSDSEPDAGANGFIT